MGICLSFNDNMNECDLCFKELDRIYYFCPICENRFHNNCILIRHGFCCHNPTIRKDRGRPSIRESKIEENLSNKY